MNFTIKNHNPNYIVSYVATTRFPQHALVAVSVKDSKLNKYVIINAVGLVRGTFQAFNAKAVYDEIYGFQDKSHHPRKVGTERTVNAKHFAATERQAQEIMAFINECHQHQRPLHFSSLGKNCHNFAAGLLQLHGFHSAALHECTLPWTTSRKDTISVTIASDEVYNTKNAAFLEWKPTWQWKKVVLEKPSYDFNEDCEKVANAAPDFKVSDTEEQKDLKRAIHLLKDYAKASFWHPNRHYPAYVQKALNVFAIQKEDDKNIPKLIELVRAHIKGYHKINNDAPNMKGGLAERLMYIECVLADSNYSKIKTPEPDCNLRKLFAPLGRY